MAQSFRTVLAGGSTPLPGEPHDLDVAIAGAGRMFDLGGWNAFTHGTSLVVLDGTGRSVVHEWYAEGLGRDDCFLGASMTKSALAHLVGVAVRAGSLGLDDRVVDHVPELADSGYDPCTVRDVLTMTSGVDWVEDHRDPSSLASRLIACFGPGGGESRALLTRVGPRSTPGTRWEYCTADSQVLDWARERATGAPYDVALGALWRTLGCTSDAVRRHRCRRRPDGRRQPRRDSARLGPGRAPRARRHRRTASLVLDPEWVHRSTRAPYPFTETGRLPSSDHHACGLRLALVAA